MKVFISGASEDGELAKQIAAHLGERGFDVWDEERALRAIYPGDNWARKVADTLDDSDAMVVLLTPESVQSKQVRREIAYALSRPRYKDHFVPVLTADLARKRKFPFASVLKHFGVRLPSGAIKSNGIHQVAEKIAEKLGAVA